jgi:hypothetical protein
MAGAEDGEFDDEPSNFAFHNDGREEHQTLDDGKEDGDNDEQGQVLHQGSVPNSWILLDNQSTVNVFSNPALLRFIATTTATNRWMTIRCNAGTIRTNMMGKLPGCDGDIWFNPKGIANILSLSDVEKYHKITYGSTEEKSFIVHKENGGERRF